MRARTDSLWRDSDFIKYWVGRTVSLFGTEVSNLALPLVAVVTLQAQPFEVSMLRTSRSAAAALAALFAGVLVDRLRRRPILIGTDLGFALLMVSIPVASFAGLLRVEQLYLLQFLSGLLSVSSDVAQLSFLPSLIGREKLIEGNSKLQAASSAASIAGPGLGGVLVQLLSAPIAIIVDACSFVVSAFFVWRIRTPEPPPAAPAARRGVWAEIGEGLRTVFGSPLLRPLAESVAAHFMFTSMIYSILILYMTRELGIEPALLGLVFAAFGPGLLLGALVAERAARRYGPGPAMLAAMLLNGVAGTLIAAARGPLPWAVSLLMTAHFLLGAGMQVHGINLVSLRQAMTADRMQGRVNACFRFNNLCAITAGALLAGTLGELLGLRATLTIAGVGLYVPFLRLLFSPARTLREQPAREN